MSEYPAWQYDEMQQIGKDYDSLAEVEAYDIRHGRFRNIEKENEDISESLKLQSDDVVIEFGSGTGAFAIHAARRCAWVYAVDISHAMLEYTQVKAAKACITNVVTCHGGFLTHVHTGQPVDAIVTNTAFHHLPDFWKGLALKRLNGMLKLGGLLYLSDIVFEDKDVQKNIEQFIARLEKVAGPEIRSDVEAHIRQEFSTYDWIMEGLFERAGFTLLSKVSHDGVIGRYLCSKTE